MPEPILKTTDLTKSYPSAGAGDLTVLDGIEIEVPAGATCRTVWQR